MRISAKTNNDFANIGVHLAPKYETNPERLVRRKLQTCRTALATPGEVAISNNT